MARRSRFGMQFEGFTDLTEQYDRLGGDLKGIVNECLIKARDIVTPKLQQDMRKHKRSGRTEAAIITNSTPKWEGDKGSIDVGFEFPEGLPSIFLMYGTKVNGTPRVKPYKKLYNDIYGGKTKREIKEAQEQILKDAIRQRLGG